MNKEKQSAATDETIYGDSVTKRPHPEFSDYFRPQNVTRWLFEFLDTWFHSRSYRQFGIGVPFLIVAIGGCGFVWWLSSKSYSDVIVKYETAAQEALQTDDSGKVQVYLRQLLKLRPNESRYKMQLVLFLVENGQKAAAIPYLNQLLEKQYVPARLWIVRQSASPDAILPQSIEQVIAHLQSVLSVDPDHYEANHQLAQIRIQQGQLRLAESHLITAVQQQPELGLTLARLQKQLGSRDEQVRKHLKMALEAFETQTRQDPSSVDARIGWADTLTAMERYVDAEVVLKEGRILNDDPKFGAALSNLYLIIGTMRLKDSLNNREMAAQLMIQAAVLNPENRNAVVSITNLAEMGVVVDKSPLTSVVDHWRDVVGKSHDVQDRVLLANLLSTIGKTAEAIRELEDVVLEMPQFRAALARLHIAHGDKERADALLNAILTEKQQQLETNPADVTALARTAEALIIAARFEECRTLLKGIVFNGPESTDPPIELDQRQRQVLAALLGQACLELFDETIEKDSADRNIDPFDLIDEAHRTQAVSLPLIHRLSQLSFSDDPLAKTADRALNTMLATGRFNSEVYKQLGTKALQADQFDKAIELLQRANKLTPRAADVLNNLAMALIRSSPNNADRAMELANEALELLPNHPDVLATRGEIYMARKDWNSALADLERALLQRQENSSIHRLLATVYDTMGESELADQHRKIIHKLGSS